MDTLIIIGGILFIIFMTISLGAYSYALYKIYKIKKDLKNLFKKKNENK